jgi:hypothetical protein
MVVITNIEPLFYSPTGEKYIKRQVNSGILSAHLLQSLFFAFQGVCHGKSMPSHREEADGRQQCFPRKQ